MSSKVNVCQLSELLVHVSGLLFTGFLIPMFVLGCGMPAYKTNVLETKQL
jgi:hypothetical protein